MKDKREHKINGGGRVRQIAKSTHIPDYLDGE